MSPGVVSVVAICAGVYLWLSVARDYRSRTDTGEIPPGVITADHHVLLTLAGVTGLYGVITLVLGRLWW